MSLLINQAVIFNFSKPEDVQKWEIINDGVMGGKSAGYLSMDDQGNGVFRGNISLQNNGGFSMISHRTGSVDISDATFFRLRVKGDGNRYEFRIRALAGDRHSYVQSFKTSGDWEIIEIPMKDMFPTFRGMKLDIENYAGKKMNEISILAGNKKEEPFRILIDRIETI